MILKFSIFLFLLKTFSAQTIIVTPAQENIARVGESIEIKCRYETEIEDFFGNVPDIVLYGPNGEEIDRGLEPTFFVSELASSDFGAYRCSSDDDLVEETFNIIEAEPGNSDVFTDGSTDYTDYSPVYPEYTEPLPETYPPVEPYYTEAPVETNPPVEPYYTEAPVRPYTEPYYGYNTDSYPANCQYDEFTCNNGQCVSRNAICDGRRDCNDGSDEERCSISTNKCEPNERSCNSGQCAPKFWFCDGEPDCRDGSDEGRCPAKGYGDMCESYQFQCLRSKQCISKAFVCDGQIDCQDGSDEQGCSQPTIVRHPQRNIDVCLGQTITITCEARGFPAPYINWRLNWGHIPAPPRCSYTTTNGYGVLTITNAIYSDAGAYSCEALSTKGRIFAIDAIVTVRDCGIIQTTTRRTTIPTTTTPRPVPYSRCNPNGILPGASTYDKKCKCKCGYDGDDCYIERLNFYTHGDYCHQCFCNGFQLGCRASNYYYRYNKITEYNYETESYKWRIASRNFDVYDNDNLVVGLDERREPYVTYYNSRSVLRNRDLYFVVPKAYLGNQLVTYDGNMTFSIKFECSNNEYANQFDVLLKGNNIALIASVRQTIYSNQFIDIVIHMVESSFKTYPNNNPVSSEHMRMVLANIDEFVIQASINECQQSVTIKHFNIDQAKRCRVNRPLAYKVEVCVCPPGYKGLSCEQCDTENGYYRTRGGSFLGTCERRPGLLKSKLKLLK